MKSDRLGMNICMVLVCLVLVGSVPAQGFAKVYKEYYPSGKLMAEFTLKFFTMQGPCRTYYESGPLMEETPYVDGKRQGLARKFYENGALEFECEYKDDLPLTKKVYYPGGALKELWDYTGQKPGHRATVKHYDENGKLTKERVVKKKKKKKKRTKTGTKAQRQTGTK
ncbi:toxin-antitoxin system YwqK family antitoxin [Thermodesulfobacteriota bacterium]